MKNIKWAAIQPLTGGFYIGAEEAFGYPAEWILTYNGLDEIKRNKEGNITAVANEAYLLNYLKKVNREVPYYKMNRAMFDCNVDDMNPEITLNGEPAKPDYDVDVVVAVPVCSGLSMVTSAKDDTKNERNCNMLYLVKLALTTIRPKVYLFENAPTLMGFRGDELRKQFEKIASENGYVVVYYKTDTWKHYNCQKRPRTFVMFVQKIDGESKVPTLDFVDHKMTIEEFFANIPEGLANQDECEALPHNYMVMDFFKKKYGDAWIDNIDGCLMKNIVQRNLINELLEFMESYDKMTPEVKEKTRHYLEHIRKKTSMGLSWYGSDCCYYKEHFPAIQFRSITTTIHPSGERMCNVREYLELMGMPHDFEWFGDKGNWPKIGQNVPVKTAKFLTEQAIKVVQNWNNDSRQDGSVIFFDNTNNHIKKIA